MMTIERWEMSGETHVTELLSAYALGCLDQEDEVLVSEHLATCPACRAELGSYQAVVDRLAWAAPDAVPPARLKQRLLQRVGATPPLTLPEPRLPWWEQLAGLWRRVAPAWGVVSLVLILALAAALLLSGRPVDESATGPGGLRVVALTGTAAAPGSTGTIVISADGEYGTLVVDGLAPLGEAQQYQLWLIRDGARASGGVFSVSPTGYGALWISSPEPLSTYPSFGITIEPAGGSPGPTGDKVLGGSL
jgi:anti-sigma-K factor RskA